MLWYIALIILSGPNIFLFFLQIFFLKGVDFICGNSQTLFRAKPRYLHYQTG